MRPAQRLSRRSLRRCGEGHADGQEMVVRELGVGRCARGRRVAVRGDGFGTAQRSVRAEHGAEDGRRGHGEGRGGVNLGSDGAGGGRGWHEDSLRIV